MVLALLLVTGQQLATCAFQSAGDLRERWIGPGARFLRWTRLPATQTVFAVEADLDQPLLRAGFSVGGGASLALEPLSQQAERLTRPERYPIAGVNGDFFFYPSRQQPGIPTNALVVDGELLRTPSDRSCLVLNAAGRPSIRRFRAAGRLTAPGGTAPVAGVNTPRAANQLVLFTQRFGTSTRTTGEGTEVSLEPERLPLQPNVDCPARVREVRKASGTAIEPGTWVLSGSGTAAGILDALRPGDAVELRFDFEPALAPGDQLLGGGPRLVRDGRAAVETEGGTLGEAFAQTLFPRTAVGFNDKKLFLVVVDGRQAGYSSGISLPDLAQLLVELGCKEAMNLDGGGSSTLWLRGSVVNRPSDGRERPVANGLMLFSTAPIGPAVRLRPEPAEIRALAGASVPLAAVGEDQHYNPVRAPERIEWSVEPPLGHIVNGRFLAADLAGEERRSGRLVARAGGVLGDVKVIVVASPARVEVLPAAPRLGTDSRVAFRVRAYDVDGRELALSAVRWETIGAAGRIAGDGTLLTGPSAGAGTVRAVVNGVTGEARVQVVSGLSTVLEGFEGSPAWKLQVTPAGTTGAVSVTSGTAHGGSRALRLAYDLSAAEGTRAVYALGALNLGRALAVRAWILGDGQGAWLRVRVRDAKGEAHLLDAARRVDWKGWREVRIALSDDFPTPLALEAFYVVETDAARKPKGEMFIDDISVEGGE